MNISYSTWKDYDNCPKRHHLKHRERAASTVPQNDYPKLYGKLVQRFFEMFCNNWRFNTPYMPADFIRKKLVVLWEDLLRLSVVDWNAPIAAMTSVQIFEKAFDDIFAIMESPNQNYFLNTTSEVEIRVTTKFNVDLTCRLDFLHTDPLDNSIMIFDGKGTKTVGKNVDKDQLYFYALLYYLHYKTMPMSLGFFYYQHNKFVAVPVTMDLLNAFRERLSEGVKKVNAGIEIEATPSWKACTYCDYRIGCTEYTKFQADHRREVLEIPNTKDQGVVQFGL